MGNTYELHKICGDIRKSEWQEANIDTVIAIKSRCKLAFTDGKTVEHMWVIVIRAQRGMYEGVVDNTPIHLKNVKFKDKVVFEHEEIEDYSH